MRMNIGSPFRMMTALSFYLMEEIKGLVLKSYSNYSFEFRSRYNSWECYFNYSIRPRAQILSCRRQLKGDFE
jgi:hypothetical protein